MNVPQEELNTLAVLALRVKNSIWSAYAAAPSQKAALLEKAASLAATLQTRLDRAGAQKPAAVPESRYEVPLALMDTPANRAYRDALRVAWECGLVVDRERYGADIGTDGCAQIIEMVLCDVEGEIDGPKGTGE